MKPRITKRLGVWICLHDSFWLGFGATPYDAYKDWISVNTPRKHET